jgi:prophage antirepressor-like protein
VPVAFIGPLLGWYILGNGLYHQKERPMQSLMFENTEIKIIDKGGEPWVAASDLSKALGYSREDEVGRIYRRNADEFTPSMSQTANLAFSGNLTKTVRIFSLRGAHLIAMFARTKKAKAFRRWVLDLLDAITQGAEYVRKQYEQASKALEDRREQASEEGRGLASWRWEKQPLQMRVNYWRERQQLSLALH